MSGAIEISNLEATTLLIPIKGRTPLIVHNFGEKARKMILDNQQGKKTKQKEFRNPEQEYLNSLYRMGDDRYGFPVTGFKAATVGAARFYGGAIKMTELRQFLFFGGEITPHDPQMLVEIFGEHAMREDVVKIGSGISDLRYRAYFPEWSATLTVTFIKNSLSKESVVSLINAGGLGCGVGEWRPQRNGHFGTYEVDVTKQINVIE